MALRLNINLDNGSIENTGDIRARYNAEELLEIGFTRDGLPNTVQMTTPALDLILKRDTGTQKFDNAQVNAPVTFTQFTEDGDNGELNYFYRGPLDLTEPVFAKLLGVDTENAREQIAVECLADVGNSLHHKYFGVATEDGDLKYVVFYTSGTDTDAQESTPNPAGTVAVSIATNATAVAVASAIDSAGSAIAEELFYTVTRTDDVITLTATEIGARGWHTPGTSGFELTLTTAGSEAGSETDIESVSLLGQFVWDVSGSRQISERFTFTLENSLSRSGVAAPGVSPGRVRSGTVTIASGTATGSVTFPIAHPSSSWSFDGLQVEYVGAGTPDVLAVGTVKKTGATGFSYYLTGTAPDGDYRLSYRTIS